MKRAVDGSRGSQEVIHHIFEGAALLVDGPLHLGAGAPIQDLQQSPELRFAPEVLGDGAQLGDEVAGYLACPFSSLLEKSYNGASSPLRMARHLFSET